MNRGAHVRKNERSAFTLVELLAVIAIVAVLMALIFPLLGKMVERSLQAKCAANLKNIYVAWGSYAADNAGRLAPAVTGQGPWYEDYWTKSLGPYLGFSKTLGGNGDAFVGTVAFCPGNKGKPYHTEQYSALSYIPNGLIGGVFDSGGQLIARLKTWPNRVPVALTIGAIDQPSKRMLFASAEDNMLRSYMDANNPGPYLATHFNGGGNILFADGHVELYKPDPKNFADAIGLVLGPGK